MALRVAMLAALFVAASFPGNAAAQLVGGGVDWVALSMGVLGGLVLFLFGVALLSDGSKEVAGERMRSLLERAAAHRVRGLLAGAAATTVLDSSSVTIILLIALVDGGLLSFAHTLPVILGSNIGTTVSSQIFAVGVDEYAPVVMLAGFLARSLGPGDAWRAWGTAALGLGLVLFGLHTVGEAVEPLKDHEAVLDWLRKAETPLWGVLAGAAFTVAIQSSSATLGIVITLASQGLVSLPAGLAMMLGAEIGTCADTLVATFGRSAAAVRAGVFHLLFNVATVALGVALIGPLRAFPEMTSGETANQVANAHVAFNVAGALLFLPFTPWIARALERVVPEREGAPDKEQGREAEAAGGGGG